MDDSTRLPDPRMIAPYRASRRPIGGADPGSGARHAQSPARRSDDDPLVRPYLVTGGRTRPIQDGLRVEALVSAMPAALHAPLKFERRRVAELCQKPHSVAEIAAALAVPLGVARVLIADMASDGFVTVQDSPPITSYMIERIRDHVRAL
jgi:hypothetical protein